jgi:hypothetical protein
VKFFFFFLQKSYKKHVFFVFLDKNGIFFPSKEGRFEVHFLSRDGVAEPNF